MSRETEAFLKYIDNGIKVYNDTDKKILQKNKISSISRF